MSNSVAPNKLTIESCHAALTPVIRAYLSGNKIYLIKTLRTLVKLWGTDSLPGIKESKLVAEEIINTLSDGLPSKSMMLKTIEAKTKECQHLQDQLQPLTDSVIRLEGDVGKWNNMYCEMVDRCEAKENTISQLGEEITKLQNKLLEVGGELCKERGKVIEAEAKVAEVEAEQSRIEGQNDGMLRAIESITLCMLDRVER